ncbi:MAG TPA: Ig-like domain-containing protein, partial [Planctomycetota bacterium]
VAPVATGDAVPPTISTGLTAVAVQGYGNDYLEFTFSEDMEQGAGPASVTNPANYSVPVGFSLAGASFHYAESTRVLRINLEAGENLQFGAADQLQVDNVEDLAGNVLASASPGGVVSGDDTFLSGGIISATQNTAFDPTGRTVDVAFDEILADASVGAATFTFSGPQIVLDKTLVVGGQIVRITLDAPIDTVAAETVDVDAALTDLAGNPEVNGPAVLATDDGGPPSVFSVTATTISGPANDVIDVVFDERVLATGATTIGNYQIQINGGGFSALGGGHTVTYDPATSTARITLADYGALRTDLVNGDVVDIQVSNVFDVTGNDIAGGTFSGTDLATTGDVTAPNVTVATTYVAVSGEGNDQVNVVFDEAIDAADAVDPNNFALTGTLAVGPPLPGDYVLVYDEATSTTSIIVPPGDNLTFGAAQDVTVTGVTDFAGNPIGVTGDPDTVIGDNVPPVLTGTVATAVVNRANDTITVTFDEAVSQADAENTANFSIQSPGDGALGGGTALSVIGASASYDIATNTVTFVLPNGADLQTADSYDLEIIGTINDLAGNGLTGVFDADFVGGDITAPTTISVVDVGLADQIFDITFSEDMEISAAETAGNYTTSDASNVINAVLLEDGNTVRISLNVALGAVATVDIAAGVLFDLAGNAHAGSSIDPL